ncbi:MAG TPA: hypothetical protein PKN32_06635 [Bacteroidales bacterium]|nr:hypothetical protein [Bacteroidales bacterium]
MINVKIFSIVFMLLFVVSFSMAQGVAINTDGATADGSAMLDVKSTNSGLLIPRINIPNLAAAAPVTSPVVSLLVYNTNAGTGLGYHYWNGSAWVKLFTAADVHAPKWSGNNNTTDAIGRTGNVGIGTASPSNRLHVAGATRIVAQGSGWEDHLNLYSNDGTNRWNILVDNGASDLFRLAYNGGSVADVISATTSGNVGIARSNPAQKLDVLGRIRASDPSYPTARWIDIYSSSAQLIETTNDLYIGTTGSSAIHLQPGRIGSSNGAVHIRNNAGTNWASFDGVNQRLGVGTSSPSQKLDVQGGNLNVGTLYGTYVMYGTLGSFDTRATNPNPEIYNMGVTSEFKGNAANGLSDGGTYNSVLSIRQWGSATDWSGGGVHQMGFTANGNIWHRYSQTTGVWGPWRRLYDSAAGGVITCGTTNYVVKSDGTNGVCSQIYDNGTNVGIGTASPTTKLTIAGGHGDTKLRLYSTGDGGSQPSNLSLWASEPGVTYVGTGIGYNVNGHPFYGRIDATRGSSYIRFLPGETKFEFQNSSGSTLNNIVVVEETGRVGVGTDVPVEILSVYQPIGGWQGRFANSSGSGSDVYFAHGGGYGMHIRGWNATDGIYTLEMYNNTSMTNAFYNSGRVALGMVGNVGVGTTSPAYKLDVASTIRAQDVFGAGGQNIIVGDDTYLSDIDVANTMGVYGISNTDRGGIRFGSGGGTVFGYNGNIGIGTATPGYRLDLASGTFAFGNANQRTESRDNAGLQGDAGAQSGFFETASPSNYPAGASSWWHLIDCRHSNTGNNYALQIAGSFFDQKLYFRKTNNNAAQAWSQIYTSADGGLISCGSANYLVKSDGTSGVCSQVYDNGTNVGIGTGGPSYKLHVIGDIYANGGWLRTSGSAGWYSESYGGGWYMSDGSWIRTYNSKNVWTDSGLLGSQGGLTVGYGGAGPPSGGAIVAGYFGIGNSSPSNQLHVTTSLTSCAVYGYNSRSSSSSHNFGLNGYATGTTGTNTGNCGVYGFGANNDNNAGSGPSGGGWDAGIVGEVANTSQDWAAWFSGDLYAWDYWDIAEMYSDVGDIPDCAVVSLVKAEDDPAKITVKICTQAYDANLVGVKSENPAIYVGATESSNDLIPRFLELLEERDLVLKMMYDENGKNWNKELQKRYEDIENELSEIRSIANPKGSGDVGSPIALVGRVRVLATTENGPIKPGDPITSSNVPGYGMKATQEGPIIGFAYSELKEGTGKIVVNISRSHYSPSNTTDIEYLKNKLLQLEQQIIELQNAKQ